MRRPISTRFRKYSWCAPPQARRERRVLPAFTYFYDDNTEVKPTVVTLTPDMAEKSLGNPDREDGYTRQGTLEEWTVIADAYFEALAEQ